MNKYRLYFDIYGKKMKTTIEARSLSDAKDKLIRKLHILKVEKVEEDPVDHLKSIFGF